MCCQVVSFQTCKFIRSKYTIVTIFKIFNFGKRALKKIVYTPLERSFKFWCICIFGKIMHIRISIMNWQKRYLTIKSPTENVFIDVLFTFLLKLQLKWKLWMSQIIKRDLTSLLHNLSDACNMVEKLSSRYEIFYLFFIYRSVYSLSETSSVTCCGIRSWYMHVANALRNINQKLLCQLIC